MSSIQKASSSVSSTERPEAGSSSSRSFGSVASARRQLDDLAHAVGQAADALARDNGLKIEEVDHLLHGLAMAVFLALGRRA